MKALAIIWGAVAVVAGFTYGYANAYIDSKVNTDLQHTVEARDLQPAETVYHLQTTVSGESLQYGYNPQQTINGNQLQGSVSQVED